MENNTYIASYLERLLDVDYEQKVADRGNFDDDELYVPQRKNICPMTRSVFKPLLARNIYDEWKYIVNVDGFTQHINADKCE